MNILGFLILVLFCNRSLAEEAAEEGASDDSKNEGAVAPEAPQSPVAPQAPPQIPAEPQYPQQAPAPQSPAPPSVQAPPQYPPQYLQQAPEPQTPQQYPQQGHAPQAPPPQYPQEGQVPANSGDTLSNYFIQQNADAIRDAFKVELSKWGQLYQTTTKIPIVRRLLGAPKRTLQHFNYILLGPSS